MDINKIKEELEALGAEGIYTCSSNVIYWGKERCDTDEIQTNGYIFRKKGLNINIFGDMSLYANAMDGIYKDELEQLGITDLLNLQPHEKGLLRVKYGITELDLYVPEQLKGGFYED